MPKNGGPKNDKANATPLAPSGSEARPDGSTDAEPPVSDEGGEKSGTGISDTPEESKGISEQDDDEDRSEQDDDEIFVHATQLVSLVTQAATLKSKIDTEDASESDQADLVSVIASCEEFGISFDENDITEDGAAVNFNDFKQIHSVVGGLKQVIFGHQEENKQLRKLIEEMSAKVSQLESDNSDSWTKVGGGNVFSSSRPQAPTTYWKP